MLVFMWNGAETSIAYYFILNKDRLYIYMALRKSSFNSVTRFEYPPDQCHTKQQE